MNSHAALRRSLVLHAPTDDLPQINLQQFAQSGVPVKWIGVGHEREVTMRR
jgi:hypothetical protein